MEAEKEELIDGRNEGEKAEIEQEEQGNELENEVHSDVTECLICGKLFPRGPMDLARHSAAVTLKHVYSDKKSAACPYGCKRCCTFFTSKDHLEMHCTKSRCNKLVIAERSEAVAIGGSNSSNDHNNNENDSIDDNIDDNHGENDNHGHDNDDDNNGGYDDNDNINDNMNDNDDGVQNSDNTEIEESDLEVIEDEREEREEYREIIEVNEGEEMIEEIIEILPVIRQKEILKTEELQKKAGIKGEIRMMEEKGEKEEKEEKDEKEENEEKEEKKMIRAPRETSISTSIASTKVSRHPINKTEKTEKIKIEKEKNDRKIDGLNVLLGPPSKELFKETSLLKGKARNVPPPALVPGMPDKTVECLVCGKLFPRGELDLQRHSVAVTLQHKVSKTKSSAFPFSCAKCKTYFSSAAHLKSHGTLSSCYKSRVRPPPTPIIPTSALPSALPSVPKPTPKPSVSKSHKPAAKIPTRTIFVNSNSLAGASVSHASRRAEPREREDLSLKRRVITETIQSQPLVQVQAAALPLPLPTPLHTPPPLPTLPTPASSAVSAAVCAAVTVSISSPVSIPVPAPIISTMEEEKEKDSIKETENMKENVKHNGRENGKDKDIGREKEKVKDRSAEKSTKNNSTVSDSDLLKVSRKREREDLAAVAVEEAGRKRKEMKRARVMMPQDRKAFYAVATLLIDPTLIPSDGEKLTARNFEQFIPEGNKAVLEKLKEVLLYDC